MKKLLSLFLAAALLLNVCYAEDHWDGQDYHKNSSSQKEAAKDLLSHIALKGDENVLDIGCGDGKITAEIAKQLGQGNVLGIDISPSMIQFASQAFPKQDYSNLDFKLMAAEEIDFNDAFDLAVSFATLQWIQNHPLVIEKIFKSLRPSGRFGVSMPMGLPSALEKAVNEVMLQEAWKNYFVQFSTGWNFVSSAEYGDMLQKQGFSLLRLEIVRQEDVFPSVDVFKKFISQWFPYLRPLPQGEKDLFMNQVLESYIAIEPLDEMGRLHFRINRLEVVAEKNN